ncbi:MAG: hypothetical protein H7346_21835 [Burkholderiaceae bacterium]|nr:hypothetical protein [Burkholderiaceae bacterium]
MFPDLPKPALSGGGHAAFQREALFRADGRMVSEMDVEGLEKRNTAAGTARPSSTAS